LCVFALALLCATVLLAAGPAVVRPYETDQWAATPANALDAPVAAALALHGVTLRNPCSDDVFLRRVTIDAIGTLPTPAEVDAFAKDRRPDKRAALVESLLIREEFADYWSLQWCDVLRVKSEFPVNLWPNAVQAYHRWVRDAIRENRPYDQFARDLLTSSGSNVRVPPVNFYRAIQGREPAAIARAAALTFMGTRIERWPEARQAEMATIFSRVAYKKTAEWKEEIVHLNPAADGPLEIVFPDGTPATVPAGGDPRQAFADWLTTPGNPWFARCAANRVWTWTMGHGIIHEADDIRPDNPPASPEVLACLEGELAKARYDLRALYRLIFTSRTYQQSSIPHDDTADPAVAFAHYTVRRLDAEVLVDALCWIGGDGESYVSPIPEPFTFIPKSNRTIALADGSITSALLAAFGRPSRDTGLMSERNNQPSDAQSLYLLNSTEMQQRIARSPQLSKLILTNMRNRPAMIRGIYRLILSRDPTAEEQAIAEAHLQGVGRQVGPSANDVAWALINSKEFLCRH
jgi:hypothetical protein